MYTDYRYKIVETSTYASLKEDAVVSNGNEIVIPSSGETSVDIARASWIAQKGIILGSDLNIIRPTSSVHPLFLALSLSNNQVKYNLAKVAQGNSIVHLYNNNLKKVNIYFPNIVEQNKIGNILNSISNCINLHERKCEELALIKKALLQKLFPKKDEFKPEVRYKNFSDAWEQRKVSELLEERTEKAPENKIYPLMAFIANKGVAPKGDRYDRAALVKDAKNKKYKRTKLGDFIYSSNNLETGSIGLNNYGNASISPVYSIFKPTGIANSDFIGRRFVRKDFINLMIRWRQGVVYGQWRIHEKDFLRIDVSVPSLKEQQKIGNFLSDLDSLITLHQHKLERLKQLKKFLLQNMFI